MKAQVQNRRQRQTGLPKVLCHGLAFGLFTVLALTPISSPADMVASPSGTGCAGVAAGAAHYATLQAAINAAISSGDPVVKVCPGTYAEHLTLGEDNTGSITPRAPVDGPLGIGGTTSAAPLIIDGTLGPVVPCDKSAVTISGSGAAGPIINVVSGGTVDINCLTVNGESAMVPDTIGGPVIGIQYGLPNGGTISDVAVVNIRNAEGSARGIGIHFIGETDPEADPPVEEKTLSLVDCMVMNTAGVAIKADGRGTNLDVQRCMVEGPITPFVTDARHFQMSNGARGRILDTSFTLPEEVIIF